MAALAPSPRARAPGLNVEEIMIRWRLGTRNGSLSNAVGGRTYRRAEGCQGTTPNETPALPYLAAPEGTTLAISRYLHSAFASFICLGVLHSGSYNRAFATTIAAHRALDVATFVILQASVAADRRAATRVLRE